MHKKSGTCTEIFSSEKENPFIIKKEAKVHNLMWNKNTAHGDKRGLEQGEFVELRLRTTTKQINNYTINAGHVGSR